MSVTSGFYDSLNGDRRYTAKEMSAIFNGIINDGVLANIGEAFAVKAEPGNKVTVGIGRAWFNSTWVYNDSVMTLDVPALTGPATRSDGYAADVLVLEVDRSESVRTATIKFREQYNGIFPTINPITKEDILRRALEQITNTPEIHQYPLAVIYRALGRTDDVIQSQITNYIGTSHCPFVTGILQVQTIDNIVAQWESEFDTWFAAVKSTLDEDVAASLASKVAQLESDMEDHTHTLQDMGAGQLGGEVKASPTDVAVLGNSQVRNIYAGTTDLTAGTSELPAGDIYVVYE